MKLTTKPATKVPGCDICVWLVISDKFDIQNNYSKYIKSKKNVRKESANLTTNMLVLHV